jgi:hypothetical protein
MNFFRTCSVKVGALFAKFPRTMITRHGQEIKLHQVRLGDVLRSLKRIVSGLRGEERS